MELSKLLRKAKKDQPEDCHLQLYVTERISVKEVLVVPPNTEIIIDGCVRIDTGTSIAIICGTNTFHARALTKIWSIESVLKKCSPGAVYSKSTTSS